MSVFGKIIRLLPIYCRGDLLRLVVCPKLSSYNTIQVPLSKFCDTSVPGSDRPDKK